MYSKVLGAVLIVTACGGFGFKQAANHLREERVLRQLTAILDYMECELQFRLTPLPQLCRQAAQQASGCIGKFFLALAQELEDQLCPDVDGCVQSALIKQPELPKLTRDILDHLGHTLGRFDIQGQLRGLESTRQECRRNLEELGRNKQARLRGYQTLGLCAGAALAILLL